MEHPASATPLSFSYQAQTADHLPLSGAIDAPDVAGARLRLEALGLRVLQLEPQAPASAAPRARPLRGDMFIAFNRQLAQLAAAGLPVEQGLRLLAVDLRSGRLSATLEQVAADLDRGATLPQALERSRSKFPPLYSRLVDAGIRSGNLAGMLLNLGRHLEMVQRLQAMLWRAMAYPFMVLIGLIGIMIFLGLSVLPKFQETFKGFGVALPPITQFLITIGHIMPALATGFCIAIVAMVVLWRILWRAGYGPAIRDQFLLRLPLVGPVLRWNLVARWADAMRVCVEAGLDLPGAMDLATEAITSPRIARDAVEMRRVLESGDAAKHALHLRLQILPLTLPVSMALASDRGGLAESLAQLSALYQEQAETRMSALPVILIPIFLLGIAIMVGLIVLGLFAPLISLIQAVTFPHK